MNSRIPKSVTAVPAVSTFRNPYLGESYRLIAVKATLHNNSKVLVRLHRAVCLLQQTSPMDDETVIAMYRERIEDNPTDAYDHAW